MANTARGELCVDVEGAAYTLRPSFNALCRLDTELIPGGLQQLEDDLRAGRLTGLRVTIWALLQKYHGDEIKTFEDAGDWIDRCGHDEAQAAAERVIALNEVPAEATAAGASDRPQPARAVGTGEPSSRVLVRSV